MIDSTVLAGVAGMALLLSACAASNGPTEEASGLGRERISVLFQGFPEGSVCSVATRAGVLTQSAMPGKIDYAVTERDAPVSCVAPDGARFEIDVAGSLIPSFSRAGITVYPDKGLFATFSSDAGLIQSRNPAAVRQTR